MQKNLEPTQGPGEGRAAGLLNPPPFFPGYASPLSSVKIRFSNNECEITFRVVTCPFLEGMGIGRKKKPRIENISILT